MIPVVGPARPVGQTPLHCSPMAAGPRPAPKPLATRAETARAIDPPPPAAGAEASDRSSARDLHPRDPDAPTGPRPSFETNVLDRVRERAALRARLDAERRAVARNDPDTVPDPAGSGGLGDLLLHDAGAERPDPYETPPARADRATQDVVDLRRREAAPAAGRIDVTR